MRLMTLALILLCSRDISFAQDLSPGEWKAYAFYGTNMYTSNLVANATRTDSPKNEFQFGNPRSEFGVKVVSPGANTKVTVRVESQKLIQSSTQTYILPQANKLYDIYPALVFDYDQMLRVRQGFPEVVQFSVSIDGGEPSTQTLQMSVRPITEVVFIRHDKSLDKDIDQSEMFGAYVNEDHPLIDKLLAKAVDADGRPMEFTGYQSDEKAVLAQLKSIWQVLKTQGFRYSSITDTARSERGGGELTQHVRLLGDSFRNKQANCVDGTVLIASILEKIGLDSFLIFTPDHMYLGVDLDEAGDDYRIIETTVLAESTFEEACKDGDDNWDEHQEKSMNGEEGYDYLYVSEIRDMGILPLRDVEGARIELSEIQSMAPSLAKHVKTDGVQLRITNACNEPIQVSRVGIAETIRLKRGESVSRSSLPGEKWNAIVAGRTVTAATPETPVAEWMITPESAGFQVNLNQLRQYANSNDLQNTLNAELSKLADAPRTVTPPPEALIKMEPGWGVVTEKAVRMYDKRDRKLGKMPSGSHFEILDESEGEYLVEWEGKEVWISASETSTWDEAYQLYNQDVKDDPTGDHYFFRGELVWLNGNPRLYPLALKDFNEAISRDPKDAYLIWNRGGLLCDMGKVELGLADLKQAEEIDPEELPPASETYHIVADAYATRGDSDLAQQYRKAAMKAERQEDRGQTVAFITIEPKIEIIAEKSAEQTVASAEPVAGEPTTAVKEVISVSSMNWLFVLIGVVGIAIFFTIGRLTAR